MLKAYVFVQQKLEDLRDNCKGVTAMEYGIIAATTVVIIGGVITGVGNSLGLIWAAISAALLAAVPAAS